MIPIRTEMVIRRTPMANYALVGLNVVAFLLVHLLGASNANTFVDRHLMLQPEVPALYQFFTYQFLHADLWHLGGNMIFLWVFGNSVNAKMGDLPYLMFYLACGVFAGWGFAIGNVQNPLLGASGAIAGVTTAFLVLFPRSHVTVMYFFFFIGFFDIPAMLLILLKIILWDNILAPSLGPAGNVAYSAHLAGYVAGFVGALAMLMLKALPRDHFDMLSLLDRWNRRRQFRSAMSGPGADVRASYGRVAREVPRSPQEEAAEDIRFDRVSDLRAKITDAINAGDVSAASRSYEELVGVDPRQCLPARQQIAIGREFVQSQRFSQAASAFDRYLVNYPGMADTEEIRLLTGIIYTRDLQQHETAEKHLKLAYTRLREESRRKLAMEWLESVCSKLGKAVDYA